MILSVASGKGGTGKTIFSTTLADTLNQYSFIDCDVEAPNAYIFLKPHIEQEIKVEHFIPIVDEEKCTLCGLCVEHCEHNALGLFGEEVIFFPELCHGCPTCKYICPEGAISDGSKEIGIIRKGSVGNNPFADASLKVGEIQSATIIAELKKVAEESDFTIIDCPPCTGHPLIRAVRGSDFVILVTEPTPFGLHDLKQAIEVVEILEIPYSVVINRDGIGTDEVERYCSENDIEVAMKIPYSEKIARAYSKGEPIYSVLPEMKEDFQSLIERFGVEL